MIQLPPDSTIPSNDGVHSLPHVKPMSRKALRMPRKDLPTFFF